MRYYDTAIAAYGQIDKGDGAPALHRQVNPDGGAKAGSSHRADGLRPAYDNGDGADGVVSRQTAFGSFKVIAAEGTEIIRTNREPKNATPDSSDRSRGT